MHLVEFLCGRRRQVLMLLLLRLLLLLLLLLLTLLSLLSLKLLSELLWVERPTLVLILHPHLPLSSCTCIERISGSLSSWLLLLDRRGGERHWHTSHRRCSSAGAPVLPGSSRSQLLMLLLRLLLRLSPGRDLFTFCTCAWCWRDCQNHKHTQRFKHVFVSIYRKLIFLKYSLIVISYNSSDLICISRQLYF